MDELTGLLDRPNFTQKLDQALAQILHDNSSLTLVFLDVNDFMQFNQMYGIQAGDELLKALAGMFSEAFGKDGLVGRYGGDELIAAIIGQRSVTVFDMAARFQQRISKNRHTLTVSGQPLEVDFEVSLGLATCPTDAYLMSDLIEKAKEALFRERARGRRGGVSFYEQKDSLTGLLNQYGTLARLDEEIAKGEPFSILSIDVDNFSTINTQYGRRGGDDVLRQLAAILQANFSEPNVPCRLGGDEIIVMMPGLGADSAFVLAEEVRRVVEQAEVHSSSDEKKPPFHFTISGGIACYPADGSERVDLLRKADEALYRAKRLGRNRICLPTSAQMVTKTSHYTQTQLERLAELARSMNKSEAFLLREALDELLRKYTQKK
ncbi:MAG TPA: GGDEF domain-containing protein [Anaerolineaceae bacterium]|nr:GGDEF domain-containing protein [Anaerolineaceae bacterium]HPN51376.1 GGDEF domain-containing protein [Anaerolineaceae bacterium]